MIRGVRCVVRVGNAASCLTSTYRVRVAGCVPGGLHLLVGRRHGSAGLGGRVALARRRPLGTGATTRTMGCPCRPRGGGVSTHAVAGGRCERHRRWVVWAVAHQQWYIVGPRVDPTLAPPHPVCAGCGVVAAQRCQRNRGGAHRAWQSTGTALGGHHGRELCQPTVHWSAMPVFS